MTTDVFPILSVTSAAATPTAPQSVAPRSGETAHAAVADAPAQAASALAERASPQAVQQTLAAVAQQIESYLRSVGRSLEFSVDEVTGHTIVTVRDSQTGEVIRQIPGEETQRLARALGNQSNVLIDLLA